MPPSALFRQVAFHSQTSWHGASTATPMAPGAVTTTRPGRKVQAPGRPGYFTVKVKELPALWPSSADWVNQIRV